MSAVRAIVEMDRSIALLDTVLADVARAVVSTQRELDRLTNEPSADLPLPPLAFVVKQTQVILRGNLSVPQSEPPVARDGALVFAQVDRVQASLRGAAGAALTSSVSVSIQAVEPRYGR